MKTKSKYGPRDATAHYGFTILHSCSPVQAWGAEDGNGAILLNCWIEQTRTMPGGGLQVNVFDRADQRAMGDGRTGQGARARQRHVTRIANATVDGYALLGHRGVARRNGVQPWVIAEEQMERLYRITAITDYDESGIRWASLAATWWQS